eukprot:jgi/Mesen1/1195/ME000128S00170
MSSDRTERSGGARLGCPAIAPEVASALCRLLYDCRRLNRTAMRCSYITRCLQSMRSAVVLSLVLVYAEAAYSLTVASTTFTLLDPVVGVPSKQTASSILSLEKNTGFADEDIPINTSSESIVIVKRQHVLDLSDFGAVGDGETDNTRVFQNAVYAVSTVAEKGGGQLYVPPGKYLTGSFNLTSHMTLYLARDAVILGIQNVSSWPVIAELPSYGRGRELPGPRHSSLIHGQNLTDVIITGENGTLDGQGSYWWDLKRNGQLNYTRGSLIELLWSDKIIIANVTLKDSPFWAVHPTYCRDVAVASVTILAPADSPNTDGVNPDSSSEVLMQDLYIATGGEAVAIKSGWDEYGIAYGMPSKNITLKNSVLRSSSSGGFAIGSEMSGGVTDVLIENVTIADSLMGIVVKTAAGRGGYVSNILVTNVSMQNVGIAFRFCSNYSEHADTKYDPSALPVVQGLRIVDVVGTNVSTAGELRGFAEAPFEGIELKNVRLTLTPGGQGFICAFVNGTACDVAPDPCPELSPTCQVVTANL